MNRAALSFLRITVRVMWLVLLGTCLAGVSPAQEPTPPATYPNQKEGDVVVRDFQFRSGETLPEVRMHYTTLGTIQRDAGGRVTNAIMVLHGTGGSGRGFLSRSFAGVLFGPGQLLDASRYFIILPDNVGHGKSSKPSDGLRARFPKYDYDDMVELQHHLLTDGLGVNHLKLIMGTSMGCMHSWVWGETYPDFMDGLVPLACLPVQIAGRNRMMRKLAIDAITSDPAWDNGEYKTEPLQGLRGALEMLWVMGTAPLYLQKTYPTRDAAEKFIEDYVATRLKSSDANDFIYQFDSSRNYDPSGKLGQIKAQVLYINSADDMINPPELGIAEQKIKEVPHGRFILLPISDQTRGHGTHSLPAIWQEYLKGLLNSLDAQRH